MNAGWASDGKSKFAREHRRQSQRDEAGNENRDGKGDAELSEEPACDVLHEEHGDEHSDERKGHGKDGKADLFGSLQSRLQAETVPFPDAGRYFRERRWRRR